MTEDALFIWWIVSLVIAFGAGRVTGPRIPRKKVPKSIRHAGDWQTRNGRHAKCQWNMRGAGTAALVGEVLHAGFIIPETKQSWNSYGHALDGNRGHDLIKPWEDAS